MDNSNISVGYNMFINHWKHFDVYSEWLFGTIFGVELCVPLNNVPIQSRIYSNISECLINVLSERHRLRVKHIPLVMS